jgi:hypothetical protein
LKKLENGAHPYPSFSPRANIQRHQLVEFRGIDHHVEVYFELP